MNTKQIWQALSRNKFTNEYFDGVFPHDLLSHIKVKPKLIICNTHSSKEPGEHWLLFFFDNKTVEFYDSLGKDISDYNLSFYNFLHTYVEDYEKSLIRTQPVNSSLCGEYCLFYAYYRCKGIRMKDIINKMLKNDNVSEFVSKHFNFCSQSVCPALQQCTKC